MREVLAGALEGLDGVEIAFVFGSLASGDGQAQSDVDLMVIGDVGLRVLAPRLRQAGRKLERVINPVMLTAADFVKRRSSNPFLVEVLAKEKLFVKGDPMNLTAWAKNGWLKPHLPTREQVSAVFGVVDRNLEDSGRKLSPDGKFNIAYNAALQLCAIALLVLRCGPKDGGPTNSTPIIAR